MWTFTLSWLSPTVFAYVCILIDPIPFPPASAKVIIEFPPYPPSHKVIAGIKTTLVKFVPHVHIIYGASFFCRALTIDHLPFSYSQNDKIGVFTGFCNWNSLHYPTMLANVIFSLDFTHCRGISVVLSKKVNSQSFSCYRYYVISKSLRRNKKL